MQKYQFIIVGQGLAGSMLAYRLLKLGKKVLVLDKDEPHTSSKVAGGLYNPVTGKKMQKTWLADTLFPDLELFYQALESELKESFLHASGIYRPFLSIEEQNDWMSRSAEPAFKNFIKEVHVQSIEPTFVKDDFGGISLDHAGFVEVEKLILAFKRYFEQHGVYLKVDINCQEISIAEDKVLWKDFEAQKIIFCGGVADGNNPFWSWLPFRPVKGEILLAKLPFKANQVLNRGVFILPPVDGASKIGSTYQWKDLNNECTEEARTDLLTRTADLMKVQPELLGQIAGIRPATVDRRPVLGMHPQHKCIGIFNGLGTKGVSLAPYFSNVMAEHLVNGHLVMDEVQVERFFSVYFKA